MISLSAQFLAWCRSKPADEEYDFHDFYGCACAQFGYDLGLVKDGQLYVESEALHDLHERFGLCLFTQPWTFSALADRVERQLAEQVRG